LEGADFGQEYIGTLSFNQDETSLVYTAEALVEKDDNDPYAKWRFKADLGEGLSGKKRPAAFIIRWDESNATVSRILTPDHLYLGQYIFSPFSTNTLFASAYEPQSDGRLLGVKGCFNRPRGIWQVDLDSTQKFPEKWKATLKKLTEGSASARSPRVVGDQLVWLSEAVGGGHVSTSTVDALNLHTNEGNVVLDVVEKPLDDGFPGLYAPANLPVSPVVSLDSKAYVAVQSTYGSRTLVVLVSLDGGYRVLHLDDEFSWNVLATDGNSRLVCSRSTSAIPYEIVLVELKESEPSVKVIDTPTLSDDGAYIE
jgi:acylaminoacyl-peptidase